MNIERFHVPAADLPADNNIRFQYPIHQGKWIRHPDIDAHSPSFCRYTLDFTLDEQSTIDLHVSADQRFELYCDEKFVGMGPDRSDLDHWSFHSYRLTLGKGAHQLRGEAYFLGLNPAGRPWAQTTIAPGFVLYAEQSPVDLNTGSAPWKVALLKGVSTSRAPLRSFFVVGPNYTIDAASYFQPAEPVDAVAFTDAGRNTSSGTIHPDWKLYPSRMPEQIRLVVGGGRIRSVSEIGDDDAFPADDPTPNPQWQALVESRDAITIAPNQRVTVLWDLQQYHTAYPQLTTTGGAGASVKIEWAESCFVNNNESEGQKGGRDKGNRDEAAGKYFRGYGDTFLPDGPTRTFCPFWWRAGRYVRIVVETKSEPVTLNRLELIESRMPLENQSKFASDDARIPPVIAIAERGIQVCAHETYMDCPYYEQMMYTGDTRIQMLVAYVMNIEDRLTQRGMELFDWSRHETGFVHERYPSQPFQLSCTFSMVWILMLRDHAWWRNEPEFIRQRLKGMRCLIEEFKALPKTYAPLLPALPGWSFMDWVQTLSGVNHPGPDASVSSLVNLLFINALLAASELETTFGESHMAAYNGDWAKRMAEEIDKRFWNEQRGLFADDLQHTRYSEHTQCLALLSGLFPHRQQRCFESLITADDLLRTTCYFSFYLLETLQKFGRGDLILQKLDFWKHMVAIGMKTPLESPDPSRSDCHAWSSHPLFHLHASVAGIRPGSPGFATVSIAPSPGSLKQLSSTIPHPKGEVSLSMKLSGGSWQTQATLPAGVSGTLLWGGQSHALENTTQLTLPAEA